jgi:magnesium transporter
VPAVCWKDLLDPTPEELNKHLPPGVHDRALQLLLEPARHGDEPRPKLESHGDYIFGVFLVAIAEAQEDEVFYQQVDVLLTHDTLLTVRKTPESREPYDPSPTQAASRDEDNPAKVLYLLVDDFAERYLDLIDTIDDEIDELEEHVDEWSSGQIRERISQLRHDILHIRRTLSPTRDAVRAVVDNRVELEGAELFTHDVELSFGSSYDKLLRASDGLELSRDLLGGVRDYHQAKIANDQNEVMKRLTAIASLLLLPTLIVGVYGQNFRNIPELHWGFGYAWSWGLIAVTTALQLWYFRRKRWI